MKADLAQLQTVRTGLCRMSSHNNLKIFSGELLPACSAPPPVVDRKAPLTPLSVQGRRILNSPN